MKFSNPILLLSLTAGLVQAGPVTKHEVTDADILNYALTLEHLEASFYEQGLKNYTHSDFMAAGCKDPIYANMKRIAEDEKSHEQFLTKALSAAGAKPVERCMYSFPSTDVKSFLAVGSMLEGVGVSAYLGAAAKIMNSTYLSEAGSILSVEARHSAYLRAAQGEVPYPQPFDNPLDFNEVYTIASPFIASCPSNNTKLPVKAFPSLMMMASDGGMMSAMPGSKVHLMAGEGFEKMMASDVHAAFITATGPMWAPVEDKGDGKFMVTVPMGVSGQSYVVLTRGNTQATDDNIVAGPAIIEVEAKKDGNMGMGMGMGMNSMSMSMSMPSGSMPSGSMSSMSSMPMAMPSGSMSSMSMPMGSGSMPMAMASGSMSSMSMPSASMTPSASMSSPSSPMFTGGATKNSMSAAVVSGAMGLSALFAALL